MGLDSPKINIDSLKHVHCVGIGGIGVSAIALMLKERGVDVTGSDGSESHVVDTLRARGIKITIGHSALNVPKDIDCLIYTIAVPTENPERAEASQRGILQLSYPEILGVVSTSLKTIAISGTHGTTTTTAMTARAMIEAGFDPTVVVGSFMSNPKSTEPQRNFISGHGKYLVVEACEYRRSFLNLSPFVLVITTVDEDHLDYYKDLADIQNAFHEMVMKVPADGAIVCDPNSPNIEPVLSGAAAKIVDYKKYLETPIHLKVPGEHNRRNAAAAQAAIHFISSVDQVKVFDESIKSALESFPGTWRRFEYKGEVNGAKIYDDYAHHPTEIRATLSGARELYPNSRIIAVFQPHLYSRTKDLFADFVSAFSDADQILLAPIYAAREPFDPSISTEMLSSAIDAKIKPNQSVQNFPDLDSIISHLKKSAQPGDIILVMGAGDIYKVAEGM